jgi:hypothetical protein
MPSLCAEPKFHDEDLCRQAHKRPRERWCHMGDVIAVMFGVTIFALLLVYIPACEKV